MKNVKTLDLAGLKKKAVDDLGNANNFILIAIEGGKLHRHTMITDAQNALAILKTMREIETGILSPIQQTSNTPGR